MTKDEKWVWSEFACHNSNRLLFGERPLSLTEWAQSGIKDPAPLLEWHEKYKAGSSNRLAKTNR